MKQIIDFSKYDKDYNIPADYYSYSIHVYPNIQEHEAFYEMANGYLSSADILLKNEYEEVEKKKSYLTLTGPVIRLYYHAVELYVKAILCKRGVLDFKHDLVKQFEQVEEYISRLLVIDSDELKSLREFLQRCDKYKCGSQFGRYPVDTKGNPFYPNEDGIYFFSLLRFGKDIHDNIDKLKKIYISAAENNDSKGED